MAPNSYKLNITTTLRKTPAFCVHYSVQPRIGNALNSLLQVIQNLHPSTLLLTFKKKKTTFDCFKEKQKNIETDPKFPTASHALAFHHEAKRAAVTQIKKYQILAIHLTPLFEVI